MLQYYVCLLAKLPKTGERRKARSDEQGEKKIKKTQECFYTGSEVKEGCGGMKDQKKVENDIFKDFWREGKSEVLKQKENYEEGTFDNSFWGFSDRFGWLEVKECNSGESKKYFTKEGAGEDVK